MADDEMRTHNDEHESQASTHESTSPALAPAEQDAQAAQSAQSAQSVYATQVATSVDQITSATSFDSSEASDEALPAAPSWSVGKRLAVTIPIFIVLLGILMLISRITTVPWNLQPTGQSMTTLASDTAVTFANADGTGTATLPNEGAYEVEERYVTLDIKQPSTGDVQAIKVKIRLPKNAGTNLPAMVFMHGAGYGTCDNSFGDVATSFASAGFVTAVLDKPVWNTTDITRDYPGSAYAYDQVIQYLRDLDNVSDSEVGIYATSESTWISSYLLQQDPKVAFQILLSPMVFSPRAAISYFCAQDFALSGANDGYQSIVRRVFSVDLAPFGLTNIDLDDVLVPQAYSIPTLVAYGSKDAMTAQVEGIKEILANAQESGNWDVTIRSYPLANHVLRIGNEAEDGTPLADDYVQDAISWAAGTTRGLTQTSQKAAGSMLYQSISVPLDLSAHRGGTIYGIVLVVLMLLLLIASGVLGLIGVIRKIVHKIRHNPRPALGFKNGFGGSLIVLTIVTLATFGLFVAGLTEVIWQVVVLAWGGAPTENPGLMYWSWPVIQIVCFVVVWAWSRVFARIIEVAQQRDLMRLPINKNALNDITSGRQPVIAQTRLGRAFFWVTVCAMLVMLLFFAFWGLFIY